MIIHKTGTTTVCVQALDNSDAGTPAVRRQDRERRAVLDVLSRVCPGFTLGHKDSGEPVLVPDGDGHAAAHAPHISVSHCATHVAVAVDPCRRIGIDIENNRPQLQRTASRFVSDADRRAMGSLSLLHVWTAKEAAYKAAASDRQQRLTVPAIRLADIIGDTTFIAIDPDTLLALNTQR